MNKKKAFICFLAMLIGMAGTFNRGGGAGFAGLGGGGFEWFALINLLH